MVRTFLTRRWLGALALALAFAVVCFFLGRWQWGRFVAKSQIADAITTHYDAAPIGLDRALPERGASLTSGSEWTHVTATGHYDPAGQLLVRNRPYDGNYGVEVLVPLRTATGTLIVDRGWVAYGNSAAQLPDVPPAPTGAVTATGWLLPGEHDLDRDLPPGQIASINLDEVATLDRPTDLYAAYLVLGSEDPAPSVAARPALRARPSGDLGPHQAYAIQWWAAMLAAPVFVFFGVRSETRAVAAAEQAERPEGSGGGSAVPVSARRVRIWDEEDA